MLNSNLPQFVAYSGYSNSGKSTVVNPSLESLGYRVISTSKILHDFTENLINKLTRSEASSYDRGNNDYIISFSSIKDQVRSKIIPSYRTLLIIIAEECLIPFFGREIFSMCAVREFKKAKEEGYMIAFESIGGSELEIFKNLVDPLIKKELVYFNVRRKGERPGIDKRELIENCHDIDNGSSQQEFLIKLKELLTSEEAKKSFIF